MESEADPKLTEKPTVKPYIPPLSFPQRLKQNKIDKDFSNFLNIFKILHINIPFIDALEQNSKYTKFIKEILAKKRKLKEHEIIKLNEEAMLSYIINCP